MARYEDGKVTLIMDNKDVETLSWENEDDRAKILRYADKGLWNDKHGDEIKSWKEQAEEYEANKEKVKTAQNFVSQLVAIKNGADPKDFLANLEKEGIYLTKKEKDDFNKDDLDPVTQKLLDKIDGLEKEVSSFKQSSVKTESTIFNQQEKVAISELEKKYDGSFYPKYEQKDVDAYMKKYGENSIYHPDIKKQYELIYKEIHEKDILKAERTYGGLSEEERKRKIKDAQGIKDGGGAGVEPKKFTPKLNDRDYDNAAQAALEKFKRDGKSVIIDD